MATVFLDDDAGYIDWLATHPRGFVLNTRREPDPDYMVLHRATCWSISGYQGRVKPGGYTERSYRKVCAGNVASLDAWVRAHGRRGGGFSKECGFCRPTETAT